MSKKLNLERTARNILPAGRKSPVIRWLILGLAAAVLIAAPQAAQATGITVTTTADSVVADASCSLREAILSANMDQAIGGCAAGSGADAITFDAGLVRPAIIRLTTAGANENAGLTGDLDLLGNLTISGDGPDAVIVDASGADRAFQVRPGARVRIEGVKGGQA